MTDTWQIIAVLFGLSTAALLICLIALAASHRRWRLFVLDTAADYQELVNDYGDLADNYTVAISRNAVLESQRMQLREVLGAAVMFEPRHRVRRVREEQLMNVREGTQAP